MKQAIYGFVFFILLILPPVAQVLESMMIFHMHMQMPLIVFTGFLMARFFQIRFPKFFEKWNSNGFPGALLCIIVTTYWMIPRAMDEALNIPLMELFKFFSLAFLAGVPLRDSWKKLSSLGKDILIIYFTILFIVIGWVYLAVDQQICNNYLEIEQITVGWASLAVAVCMIIYLFIQKFTDQSEYK
jgi:hypothetical protein